MKVLIVDDDEITLELLDHALMTAGHETAVAHNGKVGLKAFREFNPDLVLTDIEMPEMNGLELLTKIRRERSDTIVVMATGMGSEEYAVEALRLHANDYLRKPVESKELLALVKKYEATLQDQLLTQEITKTIVQSELKMELDNRLDLIFKTVDFLLSQTGDVMDKNDLCGARLGLGEILTNAIEHGNLGITYDDKSAALEHADGFTSLIEERLADPALANRKVSVDYKLDESGCEWVIKDEGDGFDWKSLPDPSSGQGLLESHGRGIMLSRFQFDELEYLGAGNIVRLKKYRNRD